jgi:hypothetical protein
MRCSRSRVPANSKSFGRSAASFAATQSWVRGRVVSRTSCSRSRTDHFVGQLRLGICPEKRLTADDDVGFVSDLRGGPEDVRELLASHSACLRKLESARSRSRSVKTPANGEFCRSSQALSEREVSASSTSSTGASSSRSHSCSHRAATPLG